MTCWRGRFAGILLTGLVCWCGQVTGQGRRDPTLPPPEAGLSSTAVDGKAQKVESAAMTIIVRDGRPYLAVGTRLYAQGEKLGPARIERISETEVWLREGGVLRKVAQFPGIQRRAVKSTPVPPTRKAPND